MAGVSKTAREAQPFLNSSVHQSREQRSQFTRRIWLWVGGLWIAGLASGVGGNWGWAQTNPPERPPANQERTNAGPPGLNDEFLDPNLDVEKFVKRFEVESREIYTARQEVIKVLGIQPGDIVADVGAGTGLYSLMFAQEGGAGWVYAVDISSRFVAHIRDRLATEQVARVTPVICTESSVNLPPNSVDRVFICDTYHHFENYPQTMATILTALKPGGTLMVIDFERIEGTSRPWILTHVRAGKEVVRQEIIDAGFEFQREASIAGFSENYCLLFRKPM